MLGPQYRVEIDDSGPEDLERADVLMLPGQDRDFPSRENLVVEPPSDVAHGIDHTWRDDDDAVSQTVLLGMSCCSSDCVKSSKISAIGSERSSSHEVSIPLRKATISTALTAGFTSIRYRPAC